MSSALMVASVDTFRNQVIHTDALTLVRSLPSNSIDCVVTSPPYFGLRDYGVDGQIGLEKTPAEYVATMVKLFREVRRVLKPTGTFWLNLGDSYIGSPNNGGDKGSLVGTINATGKTLPTKKDGNLPPKNLMMIPARVAIALQEDGWILRSEIIWAKPNAMPESVKDRPTKAHEMVYLLTKSPRYYYDSEAIMEPAQDWGERDRSNGKYHNPGTGLTPHTGFQSRPRQNRGNRKVFRGGGAYTHHQDVMDNSAIIPNAVQGNNNIPNTERNKRTVWTVSTKPFAEAHFATFPPDLIEPMILAGCPVGGVVLDPFMGSGTTALVARENLRDFIGAELNCKYVEMACRRLSVAYEVPLFVA